MTNHDQIFLKKNLALLRKYHPHTAAALTPLPAPSGEILRDSLGQPNLKMTDPQGNPFFIHSLADPAGEAAPFLKMVPEGATAVVACFGMGLGYPHMRLAAARPELQYILIFEPDPGIFVQALNVMDLSPLLSNPRILLAIGETPDLQSMAPASRALQLESIHTLRHLALYRTDPQKYQDFEAKIFAYLSSFNISGSTNTIFGRQFIANRLEHLSAIGEQHLLEVLRNCLSGVPAILVAGGPSLDKNLPLLRKAAGKAVILGVDSVLPSLLQENIEPDFISSIDPQENTYEKLSNIPLEGRRIPLICMSWVTPKVPKTFPAGDVFWVFSAKPVEAWLNRLLGGSLLTGGAGTVAHLNMVAAIVMGCNPIILIGQDLAMGSATSHAQGTFLKHENRVLTNKSQPDTLITSPAWGGGEVRTSRDFYGMKEFFEMMISTNPGLYINATEGGVHINGAEDIPLAEALERHVLPKPDFHSKLTERLRDAPRPDINAALAEFDRLCHEIDSVRKTIDTSDQLIAKTGQQLATLEKKGKIPTDFTKLSSALQKNINNIDETQKKIDSHNKLWQSLQEITMEGLRHSERMKQKIDRLAAHPATYLKWIQENLNRLALLDRTRLDVLDFFQGKIQSVRDHHQHLKQQQAIIAEEGENGENLLALAEIHLQSADLGPAEATLNKVISVAPQTALAHFHLGCIAMERAEYDNGEGFFSKAASLDPEILPRIDVFRKYLGDRYVDNAKFYNKHSPGTCKRLLLKALRYSPEHGPAIDTLRHIFRSDASQAQQQTGAGQEIARDRLLDWLTDLNENQGLASILQEEINKPETHIALMEALFDQHKYSEGIAHLQQAVTLDKDYAKYWEDLGDFLAASDSHQDAISAYEQCFLTMPERRELLKKIGNSYLALDMLEAAKAAFKHFLEKTP